MNDKRIIKIAFLSIITVCLINILIYLLMGNSIFYDTKDYILLDEKYNLNNIEKIIVNSNSSDIIIKESQDESLRVIISGRKKDNFNIDKTKNNISIEKETSACFGICIFDDKVTLYLPNTYNKDIQIESKSSDITIEKNFNLDLKATTISGDINTKNLNSVIAKTTSGDINIKESKDIKLVSTSGDIVAKKSNKVKVQTVSGDINIKEINLTEKGFLKTTSGDILVNKINNIYIEAKTVSGETNISSNNRKSNIVLNVTSTSGDITVK